MHTTVKQVLARKGHHVHSVLASDSVSRAAERMAALNIGSVVVMSSDHHLVAS